MKEAIIKSIAAIICVAIVCLAISSAATTCSEAEIKAAEITAANDPSFSDNNTINGYESSVFPDSEATVDVTEETNTSDLSPTDNSIENVVLPSQESDNPTEWPTEKIVEEYKKAALKSHADTKSQHSIKIKKILVNDSEIGGVAKIMDTLLANNSEDKDGITGGFENLCTDDIKAAKAYESGNNLIIEMDMKDQISGPRESDKSGSVGHAITAVGDISAVTKQMTDLGLPLDLNEKETKIHYTNATVKVVINKDGKIINGTWQYTVDIRLNNYKAFGQDVRSTSVVMDNTLTVNGGFKK